MENEDKIKDAIDILNSCWSEKVSDKNATSKSAKYVWMVTGGANPCDIRRYAFTHAQAVSQLSHVKKRGFKDCFYTHGKWELFKLVRVDKHQSNSEAGEKKGRQNGQ